ncbi:MAG: protein kinase [Deltaproteobacteria bacterium]|nr:protein kinase [Deltaproteobacteria bacterium]
MNISTQQDQESLEELGQRYELLNRLREEPWGEVWLASDRLLHTEIALKILPRTDLDWDAGRKILAREAVLSLTLRHPLILGVFFLGEAEDGVYLVEEPFAGESLMTRLSRKQRFSVPEALRLLEQVSQALAFAHQRGVAHQALNPLHILLQGEEVRVANFACPAGDDEQAQHLEFKAYTPPEVLRGEEAFPAGNVFSLGVLGYRLLAGSLPYPLTFDEPFPYRLEAMPVDLEEIPLPLQNLLLQCLAPEPEDRFADAGELLTQLRQLRDLPPGGSRDDWLLEEPAESPATWRRFGSGAPGILGKVWSAAKFCGEKFYTALGPLRTRLAPASRLKWGLGLAGILLVLIFLGVQVQRHSSSPPEPSPATGPTASPSLNAGPPLVETAESSTPVEPAPAVKPGPGPTAALAPPAPLVVPKREKPTLKEERYLVIAATFSQLEQARALAQRLKGKKYQAQVTKMTVKGKTSYLVRLGPFTEKKKAEETAKRLKTQEHLTPRLAQLKPKPAQAAASPGRPR